MIPKREEDRIFLFVLFVPTWDPMQVCGSLEKPRVPILGTDPDRNKCEASEGTAVGWEVGANSWDLVGRPQQIWIYYLSTVAATLGCLILFGRHTVLHTCWLLFRTATSVSSESQQAS